MSGGSFCVHGPQGNKLELAAQHEPKGMAGQLAVLTAVLATFGAVFSYMGGATQANTRLYKSNAAIKNTEASNQWSYYQTKSSKQNLAELAAALVLTDRKARYDEEVSRYRAEKAVIKTKAEALEQESADWDRKSDEQMHQHHRWAETTTALQLSTALAAIALLTRRRLIAWAMLGVGAVGVCVGSAAWLHL
ncbi:DUF4337 domain-containing protein [Roseateles sp.]|jgi:hypothetical protein|uniref:DUF4337 domain-containing protein n=1 Tax=Roseateles sp. TaxID=1971397 RepID=UPI0037CA4779